jgi:hypothetical protein
MAIRMWVASTCMVQIRRENCIDTLWQQKNKVIVIFMWCKSDLKTISKLKGSINFDKSWKKKF